MASIAKWLFGRLPAAAKRDRFFNCLYPAICKLDGAARLQDEWAIVAHLYFGQLPGFTLYRSLGCQIFFPQVGTGERPTGAFFYLCNDAVGIGAFKVDPGFGRRVENRKKLGPAHAAMDA
jgi:hypothetical protein